MISKQPLDTETRALACADLALDKKAFNVKVLDIRKLSTIADYLVLASGRSDKQTQAIAESIRSGLKKHGKALDVEGMKEGNWVIIDYGDVIVHVFHEEQRRYYDLDGLWNAARRLDVPEENPEGAAGP